MCKDWPVTVVVIPHAGVVEVRGQYCQPIDGKCNPHYIAWDEVSPPSKRELRKGITWAQKVKESCEVVLDTTLKRCRWHREAQRLAEEAMEEARHQLPGNIKVGDQ